MNKLRFEKLILFIRMATLYQILKIMTKEHWGLHFAKKCTPLVVTFHLVDVL